jgi:predicted MFS family arabinose efflux permease
MTAAGDRVTFADVLAVPEFRRMWIAEAQSQAGDQLARIALAVLVFDRTGSAAYTALTYALTFLPALIGGAVLAGVADRVRRRELMVVCDLSRGALLILMALPGNPLWVVWLLLVAAVFFGSPFNAAQSALMPNVLSGVSYEIGTGLRTVTIQLSQLVGFALGGVVIATIGARSGLLIDGATFLASATLIRWGVRDRPAVRSAARTNIWTYLAGLGDGAKVIMADRRLQILLGFGWLSALFIVPEGIAAPYSAAFGGGPTATGLLMASMPAGTALGTALFFRLANSADRNRLMGPLAIATPVPLALCWVGPGLVASLALWFLSGLFCAYIAQVFAVFARAVPDDRRGQAVGIAGSGNLAVQGIGVLVGGLISNVWSPAVAVGMAGLIAVAAAVALSAQWRAVQFGIVPDGAESAPSFDGAGRKTSSRHSA